jgi:omega-amidase
MLTRKAKEKKIWIVGGSVPEKDSQDAKLYNTCVIINPEGEIVGKHRKVHLFDINVPGKITFKESDSLSPGNEATLIDTFPWGPLGVGICYDIRFPEYAMMLRSKGAKILVYPGAFNMTTGPAHWELLQRARAVDNQLYVISCSPARDESSGGYVAWGHSTIVSPWGDIVAKAGPGEEVVNAEIDLKNVEEMIDNIPCWTQKRNDMYDLQLKSKL